MATPPDIGLYGSPDPFREDEEDPTFGFPEGTPEPFQNEMGVRQPPVDVGIPPTQADFRATVEPTPTPSEDLVVEGADVAEEVQPTAPIIPAAPVQPTIPAAPTLQLPKLQQYSSALEGAAINLDRVSTNLNSLDQQARDLKSQFDSATDPAKKAELAGQLAELGRARQNLLQRREDLRDQSTRVAAKAGAEYQATANQIAAEETRIADEQLERVGTEAKAKLAEIQAEKERIQTQIQTDRKAYQDFLERDPDLGGWNLGQGLAEIFNETVRATFSKEIPNYSGIMDRAHARAQQRYQDRARAKLVGLEGLTDDISYQHVLKKETEAQRAVAEQEILDRAQRETQRRLEVEADPYQRALLAQQSDQLAQQQEAAQAQAAEARRVAMLKEDQIRSDIELTRAKTAVEMAKEQETLAKAAAEARKGRGGPGKPKELLNWWSQQGYPPELRELAATGKEGAKRAEDLHKTLLFDPMGEAVIRYADGTLASAQDPLRAKELNTMLGEAAETYELMRDAVALRGEAGWNWSEDFWETEEGKLYKSIANTLLLKLKDQYNLGVLSESDEKIVKAIIGGDFDKRVDPRPVLLRALEKLPTEINRKIQQGVVGKIQPIKFPTVYKTAPTQKVGEVTTGVEQAPNFKTGTVRPTTSRLAEAQSLRDVVLSEIDSDPAFSNLSKAEKVEEAAKITSSRLNQAKSKAVADRSRLKKEIEEERRKTPELAWVEGAFNDAVREYRSAVGDPDSSGELLRETKAAMDRAKLALDKAKSERLKNLEKSVQEQSAYIGGLDKLVRTDHAALLLRTEQAQKREAAKKEITEIYPGAAAFPAFRPE